MEAASKTLPDDVKILQDLVLKQQTQINTLTEQVRLLKHHRFGSSSEKISPDQLALFNEAESLDLDNKDQTGAHDEDLGEVEVSSHKRQRGQRNSLPEELPRVRVEHDLPAEERICDCGCEKKRMGEETSEQLEIIPQQVRVIHNVRFKYACPSCESGIQIAKLPPSPIPKSNVTSGLLAFIIISKYLDALPLYRQEKIFERIGVTISRTSMARWVIQASVLIQPLLNLMQEHALSEDILAMDETTVQVLKEPDKPPTSTSYMWIRRGGPPDQPVVLFDYSSSRSQAIADGLLDGFSGYLQSDGYQVYASFAAANEKVISVGCWAHARRKFEKAVKAQGKGKTKAGMAMQGLSYIRTLYRIEEKVKACTVEERQSIRQSEAKPVLDKIRAWLDKAIAKPPASSTVGTALTYLHNQWDTLIHYIEDGRLRIDNNHTENAIRPFVVGRKNWLFSDTPKGAHASAALYSIIETAKLNNVEPYRYLRHIFKELPKAESIEQFEALLPWCVDRDKINSDSMH
jgi:transposase